MKVKNLDKLTTQADMFFTELECEGEIENKKSLLTFLDEVVELLEGGLGGRVERVQYLDGRHLEGSNRRQKAQFGTNVYGKISNESEEVVCE